MICTCWWWIIVTSEREIEQDKRLEALRSVQCAVRRKTEIFKQPTLCKTCIGKSLV